MNKLLFTAILLFLVHNLYAQESLTEYINALNKEIASVQILKDTYQQSVAVDNEYQAKFISNKTYSNGKILNMEYVVTLSDINPNSIELIIGQKKLSMTIVTHDKEKLVEIYQNGVLKNYSYSFTLYFMGIKSAKKAKQQLENIVNLFNDGTELENNHIETNKRSNGDITEKIGFNNIEKKEDNQSSLSNNNIEKVEEPKNAERSVNKTKRKKVTSANCKPRFSKKDKFTGENFEAWGGLLKSLTSLNQFSTKGQGDVYIMLLLTFSEEDEPIIICQIAYYQKGNNEHINPVSVSIGNKFYFRTKSGIIKFTATETKKQRGASFLSANTVSTNVLLISPVTAEQLTTLKNEPIESVLIEPDGNEIRTKTNKSKAAKVAQQVGCFLEVLGK